MANTLRFTQSKTQTIVVRRIIYQHPNAFQDVLHQELPRSMERNETKNAGKGKQTKERTKKVKNPLNDTTKSSASKRKQNAKRKLLPCDKYQKGLCSNGVLCCYMHQEFPCTLFYLGIKCPVEHCKFLHNGPLPVNILQAFIKYVKTLRLEDLTPNAAGLTGANVETLINRTQIELLQKKYAGVKYEKLANAQDNRPLDESLSFLSQQQLNQLKEMGVKNHYEVIMLNTWQLNALGIRDGVLFQKIIDACLDVRPYESIVKKEKESNGEVPRCSKSNTHDMQPTTPSEKAVSSVTQPIDISLDDTSTLARQPMEVFCRKILERNYYLDSHPLPKRIRIREMEKFRAQLKALQTELLNMLPVEYNSPKMSQNTMVVVHDLPNSESKEQLKTDLQLFEQHTSDKENAVDSKMSRLRPRKLNSTTPETKFTKRNVSSQKTPSRKCREQIKSCRNLVQELEKQLSEKQQPSPEKIASPEPVEIVKSEKSDGVTIKKADPQGLVIGEKFRYAVRECRIMLKRIKSIEASPIAKKEEPTSPNTLPKKREILGDVISPTQPSLKEEEFKNANLFEEKLKNQGKQDTNTVEKHEKTTVSSPLVDQVKKVEMIKSKKAGKKSPALLALKVGQQENEEKKVAVVKDKMKIEKTVSSAAKDEKKIVKIKKNEAKSMSSSFIGVKNEIEPIEQKSSMKNKSLLSVKNETKCTKIDEQPRSEIKKDCLSLEKCDSSIVQSILAVKGNDVIKEKQDGELNINKNLQSTEKEIEKETDKDKIVPKKSFNQSNLKQESTISISSLPNLTLKRRRNESSIKTEEITTHKKHKNEILKPKNRKLKRKKAASNAITQLTENKSKDVDQPIIKGVIQENIVKNPAPILSTKTTNMNSNSSSEKTISDKKCIPKMKILLSKDPTKNAPKIVSKIDTKIKPKTTIDVQNDIDKLYKAYVKKAEIKKSRLLKDEKISADKKDQETASVSIKKENANVINKPLKHEISTSKVDHSVNPQTNLQKINCADKIQNSGTEMSPKTQTQNITKRPINTVDQLSEKPYKIPKLSTPVYAQHIISPEKFKSNNIAQTSFSSLLQNPFKTGKGHIVRKTLDNDFNAADDQYVQKVKPLTKTTSCSGVNKNEDASSIQLSDEFQSSPSVKKLLKRYSSGFSSASNLELSNEDVTDWDKEFMNMDDKTKKSQLFTPIKTPTVCHIANIGKTSTPNQVSAFSQIVSNERSERNFFPSYSYRVGCMNYLPWKLRKIDLSAYEVNKPVSLEELIMNKSYEDPRLLQYKPSVLSSAQKSFHRKQNEKNRLLLLKATQNSEWCDGLTKNIKTSVIKFVLFNLMRSLTVYHMKCEETNSELKFSLDSIKYAREIESSLNILDLHVNERGEVIPKNTISTAQNAKNAFRNDAVPKSHNFVNSYRTGSIPSYNTGNSFRRDSISTNQQFTNSFRKGPFSSRKTKHHFSRDSIATARKYPTNYGFQQSQVYRKPFYAFNEGQPNRRRY